MERADSEKENEDEENDDDDVLSQKKLAEVIKQMTADEAAKPDLPGPDGSAPSDDKKPGSEAEEPPEEDKTEPRKEE